MPIAAMDATHPSNPTFLVMDAVSVAASAGANSAAVECAGYDSAMVYAQPAGATCTVQVQASFDEATWFLLVQHVDTAGPASYVSAAAGTARRVELAGARFVRVTVFNGSGGAYAVSAWVSLHARG